MSRLLLLIITGLLLSKDLEVGQKWHYTETGGFMEPDRIYTMEITKDTIIDNEEYFVLNKGCSCCMRKVRYIRDAGDKYFVYYEGEKHLLFDFTLKDGDTLKIKAHFGFMQDSIYVKIDSVRKKSFGGNEFNAFHLNPNVHWNPDFWTDWGPEFIKGIGSSYWCLFPQYGLCERGTSQLRCIEYADGTILTIDPDVGCKTVGVEDVESHPLQISPNPSHLTVQIHAKSSGILTVRDIQGQTLFSGLVNRGHVLNVEEWPLGLYIFQLEQGSEIWMSKFIKD